MAAPTLRLICWPFHNGLAEVSMGRGPAILASDELLAAGLEAIGWAVETETIEPADPGRPEVTRVFELLRRLSAGVAAAAEADRFPLVLAGGCNSAIATYAGAGAGGIVWFDAHADFDTTEENLSGFLDVMGLSMLTGGAWNRLCDTVPGFKSLPERRVLLAGARDLEPYQRQALERSQVRQAPGRIDGRALERELSGLAADCDGVYLHLDLDVVDGAELRANEYAAAGGPTLAQMREHLRRVFAATPVRAAALTAWDPGHDASGAALAGARELVGEIARQALAHR